MARASSEHSRQRRSVAVTLDSAGHHAGCCFAFTTLKDVNTIHIPLPFYARCCCLSNTGGSKRQILWMDIKSASGHKICDHLLMDLLVQLAHHLGVIVKTSSAYPTQRRYL